MICEYIVKPSVVYHAELDGELQPKPRASFEELFAALEASNDDEFEMSDLHEIYWSDVNRDAETSSNIPVRPMPNLLAQKSQVRAGAPKLKPNMAEHINPNFSRNNVITDAERALWLTFRRTRSLTRTANRHGVSIVTARRRIMSYRIKVARAAGIDVGNIDDNIAGRLVKVRRVRPRKAAHLRKAA